MRFADLLKSYVPPPLPCTPYILGSAGSSSQSRQPNVHDRALFGIIGRVTVTQSDAGLNELVGALYGAVENPNEPIPVHICQAWDAFKLTTRLYSESRTAASEREMYPFIERFLFDPMVAILSPESPEVRRVTIWKRTSQFYHRWAPIIQLQHQANRRRLLRTNLGQGDSEPTPVDIPWGLADFAAHFKRGSSKQFLRAVLEFKRFRVLQADQFDFFVEAAGHGLSIYIDENQQIQVDGPGVGVGMPDQDRLGTLKLLLIQVVQDMVSAVCVWAVATSYDCYLLLHMIFGDDGSVNLEVSKVLLRDPSYLPQHNPHSVCLDHSPIELLLALLLATEHEDVVLPERLTSIVAAQDEVELAEAVKRRERREAQQNKKRKADEAELPVDAGKEDVVHREGSEDLVTQRRLSSAELPTSPSEISLVFDVTLAKRLARRAAHQCTSLGTLLEHDDVILRRFRTTSADAVHPHLGAMTWKGEEEAESILSPPNSASSSAGAFSVDGGSVHTQHVPSLVLLDYLGGGHLFDVFFARFRTTAVSLLSETNRPVDLVGKVAFAGVASHNGMDMGALPREDPDSQKAFASESCETCWEAVTNEATIYEGPLKVLQGEYVPRHLGLYLASFVGSRSTSTTDIHASLAYAQGSEEEEGHMFLAIMEYAGERLPDDLGSLPEGWKESVLAAYEALHSVGVVHNDVQKRHIRYQWDENGRFKILIIDFDLAYLARSPSGMRAFIEEMNAVKALIEY